MHVHHRSVLALSLVLLTSACSSSSDGPTRSPSPASPTPTTPATASPGATASTSPSAGGSALPEGLRTQPSVTAAIADTAQRAEVDPAQVVIAAWSPVTFDDGSLGCAKKGRSYTQALVEGELLLLRVGASLFQYHARTGEPFAYCAAPTAGYTVAG
jgi:hypothetical protein